MYKKIFFETLRGKTINRTLQNIAFSNIEIEGHVVDLGARSAQSSYYRFIKQQKDTFITFTDIDPKEEGVLKVDLEQEFPIEDNSQDTLLMNNVLELIFDFGTCASECARVLKKGGRLIGAVPFIHGYHPEPEDYFRYTHAALHRIFSEAGFSSVVITPLGFGPCTAGAMQYGKLFKWKPLVAFVYITSILIDKVLNKIFPNNRSVKKENFALSYLFICTK